MAPLFSICSRSASIRRYVILNSFSQHSEANEQPWQTRLAVSSNKSAAFADAFVRRVSESSLKELASEEKEFAIAFIRRKRYERSLSLLVDSSILIEFVKKPFIFMCRRSGVSRKRAAPIIISDELISGLVPKWEYMSDAEAPPKNPTAAPNLPKPFKRLPKTAHKP